MISQASASIESLRSELLARIGRDRFALWFEGRTALSLETEGLKIGVPNLHFQQWLEGRFGPTIEEVTQSLLGPSAAVRFFIEPGLFQKSRLEQTASKDQDQGAAPVPNSRPALTSPVRKKIRRLEQFIATELNRPAWLAAQQMALGGAESPRLLFLHGPHGMGKSHLLEGIAQERRQQNPGSKILLQTAEEFANDFLEAIRTQKQAGFRKRMRNLDLWLVDDLEGLFGKKKTQEEFLSTLDALARSGGTVAFTMRHAPTETRELQPELVARLSGGLICPLLPLNLEARKTLISQLLSKGTKLTMDESMLDLIARRIRGCGRECEGLVQTLKHHCLSSGKLPTEGMVRSLLVPWVQSDRKAPTISEVIQAFSQMVEIPLEQFKQKSRSPLVSQARLVAMFLARKLTGSTCKEVAKWFQREHSTIVSAEKKVKGWFQSKSRLNVGLRSWRLEEILTKVKARLGLDFEVDPGE